MFDFKIKAIYFVLADIENELILIQRRSFNRNTYPGAWQLPGGKLETSQSDDRCLMPKLNEETGLHLSIIHKKIHSFLGPNNSDAINSIYLAEAYGIKLTLETRKISEHRWVNRNEVEKLHDQKNSLQQLWIGALKSFALMREVKKKRELYSPMLYPEFLGVALEMAHCSRKIATRYFRKQCVIQTKDDGSPVTSADIEIELMMYDMLARHFPNHGILAEKSDPKALHNGYVWLLKPIDGVKAFITGKPVFSTLISLLYKGTPVLGIIDQPFIGERWIGVVGMPTTYCGQLTTVSQDKELAAMSLYTANPEMHAGQYPLGFQQLCKSVKWVQYNAECYAYGLLALGQIDLVIEQHLKPNEVMGLIPIIEGANGFICNWNGEPITHQNFDGTLIAGLSKKSVLDALSMLCET